MATSTVASILTKTATKSAAKNQNVSTQLDLTDENTREQIKQALGIQDTTQPMNLLDRATSLLDMFRATDDIVKAQKEGVGAGLADYFADIPKAIGSVVSGKDLRDETDKAGGAEILKGMGVNNSWVSGIGGAILDIGLDPSTYITVGAGAGTKIATKEGVKVLTKSGTKLFQKTALKVGEELAGKTTKEIAEVLAKEGLETLSEKALPEIARGIAAKKVWDMSKQGVKVATDLGVEATDDVVKGLLKEGVIDTGGFKFAGRKLFDLTPDAEKVAKAYIDPVSTAYGATKNLPIIGKQIQAAETGLKEFGGKAANTIGQLFSSKKEFTGGNVQRYGNLYDAVQGMTDFLGSQTDEVAREYRDVYNVLGKAFKGNEQDMIALPHLLEQIPLDKFKSLPDNVQTSIRNLTMEIPRTIEDNISNIKKIDLNDTVKLRQHIEEIGGSITSNEQMQKIIKLNKQFFGDRKVQFVDEIAGYPDAIGRYIDGWTLLLKGEADIADTHLHESVHKAINMFLTQDEKVAILKEMEGKITKEQINNMVNSGYTWRKMDMIHEEQIAEDFIKYVQTNKAPSSTLEKIFRKIKEFIQNLVGKRSEIEKLYNDIWGGKFAVEKAIKDTDLSALGISAMRETSGKITQPLVAIHNINAEKLKAANEIGGLIAPSIAVTKPENPIEGFGDITLIGNKDLVDPTVDTRNKIFSHDIYSPRVPEPEYKINNKEWKKIYYSKDLEEAFKATGDYEYNLQGAIQHDNSKKYLLDEAERSPGLMYMYLKENSIEPQIIKTKRYLQDSEVFGADIFEKNKEFILTDIEYGDPDAAIKLAKKNELWNAAYKQKLAAQYPTDKELQTALYEKMKREPDDTRLRNVWNMRDSYKIYEKGNPEIPDMRDTRDSLRKQIESAGGTDQYLQWVNNKFSNVFSDPYIKVGGKLVPYEPNAIISNMFGKGTKGKKGGLGSLLSPNKIKGIGAKKYVNIDQAKRLGYDRLVSEQVYQEIVAKQYDEIEKYSRIYGKYTEYESKSDSFNYLLSDYARGSKSMAGFYAAMRANSYDIPAEKIPALKKWADSFLNERVPYMEAKLQRQVGLGEFTGAIVPERYKGSEIEQILKDNGITNIQWSKPDISLEEKGKLISNNFSESHFRNQKPSILEQITENKPKVTEEQTGNEMQLSKIGGFKTIIDNKGIKKKVFNAALTEKQIATLAEYGIDTPEKFIEFIKNKESYYPKQIPYESTKEKVVEMSKARAGKTPAVKEVANSIREINSNPGIVQLNSDKYELDMLLNEGGFEDVNGYVEYLKKDGTPEANEEIKRVLDIDRKFKKYDAVISQKRKLYSQELEKAYQEGKVKTIEKVTMFKAGMTPYDEVMKKLGKTKGQMAILENQMRKSIKAMTKADQKITTKISDVRKFIDPKIQSWYDKSINEIEERSNWLVEHGYLQGKTKATYLGREVTKTPSGEIIDKAAKSAGIKGGTIKQMLNPASAIQTKHRVYDYLADLMQAGGETKITTATGKESAAYLVEQMAKDEIKYNTAVQFENLASSVIKGDIQDAAGNKLYATLDEIIEANNEALKDMDRHIITFRQTGKVAEPLKKKLDSMGFSKLGIKAFVVAGAYFDKETKDILTKTYKQFFGNDPTNELVRFYDKIQNIIKSSQTVWFPAFHVRNLFSNVFTNYTSGLNDPTRYTDAIKVQKYVNALDAGNKELISKLGKESIKGLSVSDIYTMASQHRVIGNNFYTELSDDLLKQGSKVNPFGQNFFMRNVGSAIEDNGRLALFIDRILKGDDIQSAALKVKEVLFDYGDLSSFEKNVLRRFIPYYTWTRKNAEQYLKMITSQPGKYMGMIRGFKGIQNAFTNMDDEDKESLPDWVKQNLGFAMKDGNAATVITQFGLPVEAFNQLLTTNPLNQLGTIPKSVIEIGTGQNIFKNKAIIDDTSGAAFKNYPQFIKDGIGYREEKRKDKNGKEYTVYYVDPWAKYYISTLLGRTASTASKVSTIGESGSIADDILNVTTGIKKYDFDLTAESEKRQQEKAKELYNILSSMGMARTYTNQYIPAEQKQNILQKIK